MQAKNVSVSIGAGSAPQPPRPDQRMSRKFRFNDLDMDLFFMSATSWGPSGGLDIGQVEYVATQIVDGDADSWVHAFRQYGDIQLGQAEVWAARGWRRQSGEARLKAFASYRSAWQFAQAGSAEHLAIYDQHRKAFAQAIGDLDVPATYFGVPFQGSQLSSLFLRNNDPAAPVVLVIGGADTCIEDLFLSLGRSLLDRGFSVALVDLPGQGCSAADGLHWSTTPEDAISASVDALIAQFGAKEKRIALLGLSLGGYFVTRAAQFEPRFATVIATTPFPYPYELFAASASAIQRQAGGEAPVSSATRRSRQMLAWKAGVTTAEGFLSTWKDARADPTRVTVPFLSVVGTGDSAIFVGQARDWHERLASPQKQLVELDATTGADGHCQVAARLRLVQEASGWMHDIFNSTSFR